MFLIYLFFVVHLKPSSGFRTRMIGTPSCTSTPPITISMNQEKRIRQCSSLLVLEMIASTLHMPERW